MNHLALIGHYVETGLTTLQQWEVLLAATILISLAGGAMYKVWKEISAYQATETAKLLAWQSDPITRWTCGGATVPS